MAGGKSDDWFACAHANENPTNCPCPKECICREGMCKYKAQHIDYYMGYYGEKAAEARRSVATQRRIAAETPRKKPGVFYAEKSNSIFSLGTPRLKIDTSAIRTFNTGATRGSDEGKLDYEGFVSPLVTKRYAQFMDKNRRLPDGSLRGSDNWQEGIPKEAYVKSLVRHVEDVRLHHDIFPDEAVESIEDSLCAVMFNASGLLFEVLKEKRLAAKVKETLK